MSDGISIQGILINIDARVSGLLNGSAMRFLPLESEDGSTHLLNRFETLRLTPLSHKR